MSNQWIPSVGQWIVVPKLFTPGEYTIAQVTQRTKNSDGSEIWLWVDDRKFKLEHCKPVTTDVVQASPPSEIFRELIGIFTSVGRDQVMHILKLANPDTRSHWATLTKQALAIV